MKGKKRTHLEYGQRVCTVCWNKCSRSARPVEITLIKEFVMENYASSNVIFPYGMCPSSSRNLYKCRRGNFRPTLVEGISNIYQRNIQLLRYHIPISLRIFTL